MLERRDEAGGGRVCSNLLATLSDNMAAGAIRIDFVGVC